MKSSILLKEARADAELSVRELAKLADVSPSTIHRIEKEEMVPTVAMLSDILAAAGTGLIVEGEIDYAKNAFGLVRSIREDIATGDTEWVIRKTAEFVSRYDKKSRLEKLRLLVMAPPTTGSIEWDAFIAGVVEWIMHKGDIEVTGTWVEEPQYYLDHGWWIGAFESLKAIEYAGTPMSLKIRGIYIHYESLFNL